MGVHRAQPMAAVQLGSYLQPTYLTCLSQDPNLVVHVGERRFERRLEPKVAVHRDKESRSVVLRLHTLGDPPEVGLPLAGPGQAIRFNLTSVRFCKPAPSFTSQERGHLLFAQSLASKQDGSPSAPRATSITQR